MKEINILLLGETGVGKSTFINAFANYLNYETLEEAERGEPICLIPTRFLITDANYKKQEVTYGQDKNESYERKGQSVTQQCRAYCFKYGETLVRLIDTPGVGDTRGIDQDKINFDNLLSFIAEYEELHLICILLKPDVQRLTASFQYCLKQLLCHLQKNASENMVFLFTNTRATFYRPKNTLDLLEEVLGEIEKRPPNVVIPIAKHTMYCLDNDSFQFLIALRNGITFADDEVEDYSNSWKKSVTECMRMVTYITSGKNGQPLPPHPIQNTLSINETRRLIVALNKPIAKITEGIGKNVKEIENTEREVNQSSGNIANILDRLKNSEYKYEAGFWDFVPIVNIFTLSYKASQALEALARQENLRAQLNDATGGKKIKEDLLRQLRQVREDYERERQMIVKASAKFALFLKNNAIATYNDSYKDYLNEQIEEAKKSDKSEAEVSQAVHNLKKILEDYEREKVILENAIAEGIQEGTDVSLEHINTLIEQLYKLKVTGSEIKKLHEEGKSKQGVEVKREVEHVVEPSRSKRFLKALKFW